MRKGQGNFEPTTRTPEEISQLLGMDAAVQPEGELPPWPEPTEDGVVSEADLGNQLEYRAAYAGQILDSMRPTGARGITEWENLKREVAKNKGTTEKNKLRSPYARVNEIDGLEVAVQAYALQRAESSATATQEQEQPKAESETSAEALRKKYGTQEDEMLAMGTVFRRAAAHEHEFPEAVEPLDFEPVANVYDFAKSFDARDKTTNNFDIAIPLPDGVTEVADLSESDILKLTQQTIFARSIGCTVEGGMRIEDGVLKLSIHAPDKDTPNLYPKTENGKVVIRAPHYDEAGAEIPETAAESLVAASNVLYLQERGALNLESIMKGVENGAESEHGILISIQEGYYAGGVAFYGAVAEALGYHVEGLGTPANADYYTTRYQLKTSGRRPGFAPKSKPADAPPGTELALAA